MSKDFFVYNIDVNKIKLGDRVKLKDGLIYVVKEIKTDESNVFSNGKTIFFGYGKSQYLYRVLFGKYPNRRQIKRGITYAGRHSIDRCVLR